MTGEVEHLIKIGTDLQRYATAAGIHNVMTDNGYQELILLTMFGLRKRDGDWRLVRDHLNNPKIPIWFVERYGVRVWPPEAASL